MESDGRTSDGSGRFAFSDRSVYRLGMTWSISASGKKAAVLESVNAATCSCEDGSKELAQFELAKAHVASVVSGTPDDREVSVSCSGHGTKKDGVDIASSESLSISTWIPTTT